MTMSDIALKFEVTIRILFIFGRITVLIIRIRRNSKDPLFGTALVRSHQNLLASKITHSHQVTLISDWEFISFCADITGVGLNC